jgi:hypothetical protein
MIFRCRHLLLTSILSLVLSLVSLSSAQGFNFGVGLGFLRQDTEGNLVVSLPLNFPVTSFGKVGLELRTSADFVVSNRPDVSFLLSPVFSYTLRPTDFTPITLYGGPSLRLFITDAFASTRQSTWSFAGGVVGASLSLAGVVVPYGEATWSVTPTGTVFSIQSGVGFKFGL